MRTKYILCIILFLVIIEALAMSVIEYSANKKNRLYIVGLLLYVLVGYILYNILIHKQLATTNSLWNVLSIILVTCIGVFYFKEELSTYGKIGILFAILAVIFIEFENLCKMLGYGSN